MIRFKEVALAAVKATNPHKRRRVRSQQTALELLERRALLSNVSIAVKNGDLIVQGDSGNNQLVISENANTGVVSVSGLNGTRINDMSGYQHSFQFTDDMRMSFKGGNNKIRINGVNADSLQFKSGHGNDWLAVYNGTFNNASVKTAGGDDRIEFRYGSTANLTINSGHGRDDVGVRAHAVTGNLKVNSGSGRDGVLIGGASVGESTGVKTGSGNDDVFLYYSDFGGPVKVQTGHGEDETWVTDSSLDDLYVHAGGATDYVQVNSNNQIGGSPTIKSAEFDTVENAYNKAVEVADRLNALFA